MNDLVASIVLRLAMQLYLNGCYTFSWLFFKSMRERTFREEEEDF